MLRKLVLACLAVLMAITAYAADEKPIKFGLTAVVVRDNLRFFDEMAGYLSSHLDRSVTFVRRKSYREIMELLASGDLDFAWICGYPLVQKREPEFLTLLTVPVYKGKPFYRSYIIVHKDSNLNSIEDLRGRVFAYSDPDSNSGYLYPRYHLATKGYRPDNFFRQTFFTYNHAETVEAVAARFANGGAVESYIWEFLQITNPELVGQTRVIHASSEFGFPPIVARNDLPPELIGGMARAFAGMKSSADGRRLLGALHLDGFGNYHIDLYNDIRVMAAQIRKRSDISAVSRRRNGGKER